MSVEYMSGPDQVIPTTDRFTSSADGAVSLCDSPEIDLPPKSLVSHVIEMAENNPEAPIYAFKNSPDDKSYNFITARECLNLIRTAAKAAIELGLDRHCSLMILSHNSLYWVISYYAALFAGGFAGGLYLSNSAETCFKSCLKVRARIVVVSNDETAEKILRYKSQLPELRAIIQMEGSPKSSDIITWEQFLKIGKSLTDVALNDRIKRMSINQCCSVIFTSGTLGEPKAVMISHDNVNYAISLLGRVFQITGNDTTLSYLPLSHIAAQMVDLYGPFVCAPYTVYFAEKDALKGTMFHTICEMRPSLFPSVPRVAEKLADLIKEIYKPHESDPEWLNALEYVNMHYDSLNSGSTVVAVPPDEPTQSVFTKVKTALGLEKIGVMFVGSAAVAPDVKKWLLAADTVILETYGMSETTGMAVVNNREDGKLNWTGRPLLGLKTKIRNANDNGEGELCISGRSVFMGYLNDPEKTADAIDEEGYVLSGDLAIKDSGDFLKIIGRTKEIVVTSGGENVAPLYIEENIKATLPYISQAMVVGDNRKFVSVLLTLGCTVDNNTGLPSDQLNKLSLSWLTSLGLPYTTVSEVIESGPHPKVLDSIKKGLDATNEKAISNAQKVNKFTILPADFSVHSGELGPTLKLKRSYVVEKYQQLIDDMYQ